MYIQLIQYYFIKNKILSLQQWHFVISKVATDVWVYIWILYSVPLDDLLVIAPIPHCFNYIYNKS